MKNVLTCKENELKLILPYSGVFDILVIGVVHGDEPQGEYLINEYLSTTKNSKLAFIPVLNPDGMFSNSRTNSNGVDINRNFPALNWTKTKKDQFWGGEKPASEIETRFVIEVIETYSPKMILALHAPFKTVNYDGDAAQIAAKISNIIDYPVQEDIGYPTPGSLGTWAGVERKIPVITLELDEKCPVAKLKPPVFEVFKYLESLIL